MYLQESRLETNCIKATVDIQCVWREIIAEVILSNYSYIQYRYKGAWGNVVIKTLRY